MTEGHQGRRLNLLPRFVQAIPIWTIVLIALVCDLCNLFVLHQPLYVLTSVPILILAGVCWWKMKNRPNDKKDEGERW